MLLHSTAPKYSIDSSTCDSQCELPWTWPAFLRPRVTCTTMPSCLFQEARAWLTEHWRLCLVQLGVPEMGQASSLINNRCMVPYMLLLLLLLQQLPCALRIGNSCVLRWAQTCTAMAGRGCTEGQHCSSELCFSAIVNE